MRFIWMIGGVLWVLFLEAQPTLYVTYGLKASSELIIRYLDRSKEGFIKLKKKEGYEIREMDTFLLSDEFYLHELYVGGLQEGQTLYFKVGIEENLYQVKTLDATKKLTFCVAGDLYQELKPFRAGLMAMRRENPDFLVLGGDLAYVVYGASSLINKKFEARRYETFLTEIGALMTKPSGELVPLVAALGNHDYKKGVCEMSCKLFFPPHAKTYCHYDLGPKLDLVILDTHHAAPIDGLQAHFLESVLKKSSKFYKLVAYHVAAYPSVYPYEGEVPSEVREYFVPLFETYGVQMAFEHHNHAFKITHPLKGGKVDPEGVYYLGDGCMGVRPRKVRNNKAWYLDKGQKVAHYYVATLDESALEVVPKDLEGNLLHEPIVKRLPSELR